MHSSEAKVLSDRDRQRIGNGNAFIAALAHDKVKIPNIAFSEPYLALPLAERRGMLAAGAVHLTADAIRKRAADGDIGKEQKEEWSLRSHRYSVRQLESRITQLFGTRE